MRDISGLVGSLNGYLGWNKARVSCFIRMLLGLFAARTVNLAEIALGFGGDAEIASRYRRMQRFFSEFELDYTQIAKWIFKLNFRESGKFYLLIDRTNWYWGKKKINIFMLSIAYEGMAIPLFWTLLPKAGSSNFQEQKALISQFVNTFGVEKIHCLLADREFANGKFFQWLDKKKITFCIRVKEGSMVCIRNKKYKTAQKLFNHLDLKSHSEYGMAIWLFGAKVYLAGARSERGELMIVATNKHPKTAIASYLRRWEIESLFQCLKSRGFNFENTHITELERLKKLTALLAIGFVWAHKIGEWKNEIKPIFWKRFKTQRRPQYSFFRYGLDCIRELILSHRYKLRDILRLFSFIFPRPGVVT